MKVFFKDRIVGAEKARLSVFDHGYLYGDGIYETVRAYDGRVFHWPRHFQRLRQSARRLELQCPWSSAFLLRNLGRVLKANRSPNATVRITVSRGPGPLGLDPTVCPQPTLVMLLHPQRPIEKLRETGVSIGIPKIRRNHPLCLDPQIKSNNQLNTILAKIEGNKMGVFETVLLNLEGFLTEGTTSNLFFARKGRIDTPALSCGLLEGVTRAAVIHLARQEGYAVRQARCAVRDLRQADEIFLSSTTLEVMPVVTVRQGARTWRVGNGRPGPIASGLQAAFQASVRKELGR